VTGWHRHRHRPGLKLPADTANEGWGLLTGHQRGPRPGHTRGLSHGHGQPAAAAVFDPSPSPCRRACPPRQPLPQGEFAICPRPADEPFGPLRVQRSDSAQPSRNPATSGAALSGTLTILVRLVAPLTRTTSRTPNPERRSERGEGCGGGVLTHRTTRAPSRTGRLLLDASRAGSAPPYARGAAALSPRRGEPQRRGGAPARSPRAGRRTAAGAARGASSPASTVACRSTGSS
jgi:hypothetical protein